MYGDDYEPKDPEGYALLEKSFEACKTIKELAALFFVAMQDKKVPREDLHVLYRRICEKKGWTLKK